MSDSNNLTARTEFAAAINQICNERGIDPDVVLGTIKAAIIAALRKDRPVLFEGLEEEDQERFEVDLDPASGAAKIVEIETGKDVTPPGFGRIAAQTAKQVILQRVREAEKDAIIGEYQERIKTVISGMVLRFDGRNVIVDIGRGQGIMPPEEQIAGEYYKMNQRLAIFVKEIRDMARGKTIIVSRSAPELVEELFSREVPEVSSGAVEIKAIAREAGHRTKLAVFSGQDGVDPVGSCVGQKGVRVQEVINELNGEKIDIIQYSEDIRTFIAAALAPAENLLIQTDDDEMVAVVTVPDEQLSLAIGKGGQNVRLAAKLTGYKIDIKGETGQTHSATGSNTSGDDLSSLELGTRINNALAAAGIESIAALRSKIEADEAIEGVGPKSVEKIKLALEAVLAKPETSDKPDKEADSDDDSTETKEVEVEETEEAKPAEKE